MKKQLTVSIYEMTEGWDKKTQPDLYCIDISIPYTGNYNGKKVSSEHDFNGSGCIDWNDGQCLQEDTMRLLGWLGKNNYGLATAIKVAQDPTKVVAKYIKQVHKAGYISEQELNQMLNYDYKLEVTDWIKQRAKRKSIQIA